MSKCTTYIDDDGIPKPAKVDRQCNYKLRSGHYSRGINNGSTQSKGQMSSPGPTNIKNYGKLFFAIALMSDFPT